MIKTKVLVLNYYYYSDIFDKYMYLHSRVAMPSKCHLKFIYSQISQNFVAFSEYMNFKWILVHTDETVWMNFCPCGYLMHYAHDMKNYKHTYKYGRFLLLLVVAHKALYKLKALSMERCTAVN